MLRPSGAFVPSARRARATTPAATHAVHRGGQHAGAAVVEHPHRVAVRDAARARRPPRATCSVAVSRSTASRWPKVEFMLSSFFGEISSSG